MSAPPIELNVAEVVDVSIGWLRDNFSFITKGAADVLEGFIDRLIDLLMWPHPAALIVVVAALSHVLLRKTRITITVATGLLLVWLMDLWDPTMRTLALVLVATLIAALIGLPLGVFCALNRIANRIIMPILDFMQTMPAFVYLIPAISFFGLGEVSGVLATVVFSMPPAIRLTALGIKQVPKELVEAADAFGATTSQKLFKLQLPIALPTIMAGVNQTIMLSLSMVVIAGMIGAKGLGTEVWAAIQRLNVGKGFEAGLGIVILAIVLDRITQGASKSGQPKAAH